ncbi:MAG TPA: 5-formyltetrahydrofolate cyclo-ligase [Pseudolabrys sp.]|nr:5-formyltetrahydrofolate cyclo-ligase [Pseudolabrys sp.]
MALTDLANAADQKNVLRTATLARRDAMPAADRQAAAATIAERAFPLAVGAGVIVSGFFPMRSEISPLPLMRKLAAQGAQLALPVIAGRGNPLTMRAWNQGDELASGQWGIREPTPQAPQVDPDVLIVPLACFDRRGHRIGYGAGYFDMTIHRLRGLKPVTAIGIAFAQQEIDRVPAAEHDEALDLVLTEREVIDLRRKI